MEVHVSFLKIWGLIKHFQNRNQTLTLIVDYDSCFFCLSPPFSALIFLFFAFFASAYTNPTCFVKLSSLLLLNLRCKLTGWHFNSLLIPGDQTEKIRVVVAAYLPYKCKHLCMLKFRVVSLCLTTNSIYSAYSRLYNQSDDMISVM